jgi:hypothetical protein
MVANEALGKLSPSTFLHLYCPWEGIVAHYRDYSQEQARLLPISLRQQIQPGTIEHAINYLIDHEVDLRVFESHYNNDATGAPAIHPAILLNRQRGGSVIILNSER